MITKQLGRILKYHCGLAFTNVALKVKHIADIKQEIYEDELRQLGVMKSVRNKKTIVETHKSVTRAKEGRPRKPAVAKFKTAFKYDVITQVGKETQKKRDKIMPFLDILDKRSNIITIVGKRGSGKTALGLRLLENISYSKEDIQLYTIGVNSAITGIEQIDDINLAENNSVILVDEAGIGMNSRRSMSKDNVKTGDLISIARHKNMTLIFCSQTASGIDKKVLEMTDIWFVKELGLMQSELDRAKLGKFFSQAKQGLSKYKDKQNKAFVFSDDFIGLITFKLPSFWSDEISKSWA